MPWSPQTLTIDVEVMDVLSKLPEEAIVEYLQSRGYKVTK